MAKEIDKMIVEGKSTLDICIKTAQQSLEIVGVMVSLGLHHSVKEELASLRSRLKQIMNCSHKRLSDFEGDEAKYGRFCMLETMDAVRKLLEIVSALKYTHPKRGLLGMS